MTDIVERLRSHGDQFPIKDAPQWIDFASLYLVEAADEIARLRAQNRQQVAALRQIANCKPHMVGEWVIILARAVLTCIEPPTISAAENGND